MPTLDFKGKSFVHAHHLSVPFRELVVDAKKSLPAKGEKPSLDDNLIIHGDNLHALKALLPVYAGKVNCIFIDAPYNTGNEGWCYNDNVRSPLMREWLKKSANPVEKEDLERHDKWLCMMWPRIQLLRELLADDGVIFASIDDNEGHRLRDTLDEVFGEDCFIATVLWQKRTSPESRLQLGAAHDFIHVYSKRPNPGRIKKLTLTEEQVESFANPDNDPRGDWVSSDFTAQGYRPNQMYEIKTPLGKPYEPPPGRCWGNIESEFKKLRADGRMWFGVKGDARPRVKTYLSEGDGISCWTWWPNNEVGTNQESKKELNEILGEAGTFDYPKPLRLLQRIIEIATDKNSIVLDSFAGSGTTAHAVLAQNKRDEGKRKFILVETEDYADKLTAERVRRVIKGYKFEGTQREELLREPLTWTKLKKADELIEKAESFELLDKHRFDRIVKSVEDGDLVVTGETKVTEKVDGLSGSFTFVTLGPEMSLDKLLADGLPTFEALAKYVFFTATGRTLSELPKQKAAGFGFIGETDLYRVHLLYQPDKKWLQSNDAALTEKLVDEIVAANTGKKKLLIFGAAKFMSQRELSRLGVDFCQLPYAIHRILGD